MALESFWTALILATLVLIQCYELLCYKPCGSIDQCRIDEQVLMNMRHPTVQMRECMTTFKDTPMVGQSEICWKLSISIDSSAALEYKPLPPFNAARLLISLYEHRRHQEALDFSDLFTKKKTCSKKANEQDGRKLWSEEKTVGSHGSSLYASSVLKVKSCVARRLPIDHMQ